METVILREYGVVPGKDVTLEINRVFEQHKENTVFEFENGDYYFSPHDELKQPYVLSNTDASDYKTLGIWLKNMRDCVVSGNGARLWFAGQMQPVTIDGCRHLQFRDVTIDWEKPLVAEGIVTDFGENWVKLFIDPNVFPHRYVNNWLEFDTGAGEWYPLLHTSCIQYDANTLCIRKNSGDKFKPVSISDEGRNLYKITSSQVVDTAPNNIFVLRHNARLHAGIFMESSSDILVENVTVHSCGGLGGLSQFCRDVSFRKVNFVPNTQRNRKVTNGRDDGLHITSNSGTVVITQCNFVGLMDDPVNVHGCFVAVDKIVDSKTLLCSYGHSQAKGFACWAKAGDEVAFVDRESMALLKICEVLSMEKKTAEQFTLSLSAEIPADMLEMISGGRLLALENRTNTAELICTENRFGSCRARGVLVSTPRRVLIENNYFETSGSAILIAGDSNSWFESGACDDVTIRRNVFTNRCNSSHYEFCEGVISVCPLVPQPDTNRPFHKNIRICDNVFDVAGSRSVYAFSCQNLTFEDNFIFSGDVGFERGAAEGLKFVRCNGARIRRNNVIGHPIENFIVGEESRDIACDKECR